MLLYNCLQMHTQARDINSDYCELSKMHNRNYNEGTCMQIDIKALNYILKKCSNLNIL